MFSNLTPKQMEKLFCLSEECGEVVQQVSKVLRHGYEEYSPFDETKTTNKENLEREIGNMLYWVKALCTSMDLDEEKIVQAGKEKRESCKPYMHHQ